MASQVRNVPELEDVSDTLKTAIEACGVSVRSIAFEEKGKDGKQSALVRFAPLPLPWTLSEACLACAVVSVHPEPPVAPPVTEEDKAAVDATTECGAETTEHASGDTEARKETKVEEADGDGPVKEKAAQAPAVVKKPLDDGRRDGDAAKMSRFRECIFLWWFDA